MATYKNISSDWYISVDSGVGTIYVDGNLDVAGNITYVSDIAVNDAFIIVAANNTGTVTSMGLVATRVANTSFAGLRYDSTANAWQISTSVSANGAPIAAYANIATGAVTVAGANTQVQFNDGGTFGATANLTFDKSLNQLTITAGSQRLGNIGTAPAAVANSAVLYNLAPDLGASGVYARTTSTEDELITAVRARLFSIIF
jgi:hypothetical protein